MRIDTSLLIELVQQYCFLYDKTRKDFKDVQKKQNAWQEIAETLNCEVEEVKTRWRTLRERYVRESRIHETNTRSGQSQEDPGMLWEWYSNLSFLSKHIKPRKTTTNLLSDDYSNESEIETITVQALESDNSITVSSPPVTKSCTQKKQSVDTPVTSTRKRKPNWTAADIDGEVLNTLKEIENCNKNVPIEDEDAVFCKAVAFELRKITDVTEKQQRKAKIFLTAVGLD